MLPRHHFRAARERNTRTDEAGDSRRRPRRSGAPIPFGADSAGPAWNRRSPGKVRRCGRVDELPRLLRAPNGRSGAAWSRCPATGLPGRSGANHARSCSRWRGSLALARSTEASRNRRGLLCWRILRARLLNGTELAAGSLRVVPPPRLHADNPGHSRPHVPGFEAELGSAALRQARPSPFPERNRGT